MLIYRSDRKHMRAHPEEAAEAFAEGVKVKWMSTVKQFGNDELMVEQMQMLPDGSGTVGTGKYERLKADSLVLAVGEHADLEFLKTLPGVRIARGECRRGRRPHGNRSTGIFAGGDMIGGARTMTAAVGHGKKAARNIDAWLRGAASIEARRSIRLVHFRDAQPARVPRCRPARATADACGEAASDSTRWSPALSETEARYEASRCLSCGNCFECDNCYASCPEQAIVKLGQGRFYRFDYDLCTGCAVCFEQCPCHAIEMVAEPAAAAATGRVAPLLMPGKFAVRG